MSVVENGIVQEGWREAKIDELFQSWGGMTPSKANAAYWGDGIPWASSQDVKSAYLSSTTHSVTRTALDETRLRVCPVGSVLVVVRSGILAHTLPVSVTDVPVVINQDLKAFDSGDRILNRWLAAWLRANERQILAENRRDGTTVQSVQYSLLKQRVLPVPPPDEQVRLLEYLDDVNARRASIAARLAAARATVDRLRTAVFGEACSGRLTADWRDEYGISPSEASDRPPATWKATRLGDIARIATGATPLRANAAYYEGGTIPWVTSGAVNAGIISEPTELITPLALKETNVKLFPPGTLLIAMYGEGQTRGRVAELAIEAGTNQALAAIVFDDKSAPFRPYLRLFFENGYQRMRAASLGGVQPNLSLGMFKETVLSLPPIEEQREIVERAAAALAASDRLRAAIRSAEKSLGDASRAALRHVFGGDFVPTEAKSIIAGDESAYSEADRSAVTAS